MPAPLNLKGEVFGRLTVIEKGDPHFTKSGHRRVMWVCLCECGNTTSVWTAKLRNGHTRSCGCLHKDGVKEFALTHGHKKDGKTTKEYRAWASMKNRCNNPNNSKYPIYGGRGIAVCERWGEFVNFLEDMGVAPTPKHSIDRIDTNGNYEPSNCRWATPQEQANNLRTNVVLEYGGEKMTITEWAERLATTRATIRMRLRRGWSIGQIVESLK